MAEVVRDTFSGVVGAAFCTYIGFPFDYVKARLQNGQSRSVLDCVRSTFITAGPRGFFKGVTPALVSAIVENAVLFTANGAFTRTFESNLDPELWRNYNHCWQAVVGGMSGCFSAVAICPAEVVKIRMQTKSVGLRTSALATAMEILKRNGISGFFIGVKPLLFRDIPFYFVFFGSYEYVLAWTSPSHDKRTPLNHAFAGAVGGSIAWSLIFPFDVVKTRHQSNLKMNATMLGSFMSIYRENGVHGFYNGWLPAVLRGFPANGGLLLGVSSSLMLFDALFPGVTS